MSRMDLLLKVYSNKKLSVFLKSVSYITVFFSVAVYTIVLYKALSLIESDWNDRPWGLKLGSPLGLGFEMY